MNFCVDCKKKIGRNQKRCRPCYTIVRKDMVKGEKNPRFTHGRTLAHFCCDCGTNIYHMSTRCNKCAGVYRSKTKDLKIKPKNLYEGYSKKWSKCVDCGCEIWKGNKRCKACLALYQVGENNPCWKGGVSIEPYASGWGNKLREEIRQRDGHKCQECGVPQSECTTKLDVHHIDYNKKNNDKSNLISLCHACHTHIVFRPAWAEKKYKEMTQC